MSDAEDTMREHTGEESQPDDEERREVQTKPEASEEDYNSDSDSGKEPDSESRAKDAKDIQVQRELTGESQPNDKERQKEINEKLDLRCYIVKLRIQGCRYWV